MKTASEFVNEKLGDKNYTHSPYPMHREEIIAWLNEFASQNPERVREVLNDFKREFMMAQDADDMQVTFDKFINQLSDLCSGSQEKEQTKQIRLGEIFEVDGKKYAIQKPKTSSEETDPHGTITYYLIEI